MSNVTNVTVIADEKLGGVEREYAEVKRKARVGERIKVVNAYCTFGDYDNGDTFVVRKLYRDKGVEPAGVSESFGYIHDREYVVLEPVTVAATPIPADTIQRTLDGLTAAVTNLTRRVTELETAARPAKCEVIASGTVKGDLPSFAIRKPTRDEIVERAKRDVAELTARAHTEMDTPATGRVGHLTFEFVVNPVKRTVVAVGKLRYCSSYVFTRGIAKCGPDDVFNSHIGRAISLRRALGLEVPAEYVKAPQPTEVRVGDIIRNRNGHVIPVRADYSDNYGLSLSYVKRHGYPVIDDSREEVGA